MSPIAKFIRREGSDRRLFFEALRALVWAKWQVHTVPFRRLAPQFGRTQAETPPQISVEERAIAVKVSWAVQTAARYVPLGFVCLPQAMAAQRMLRRRGIESTLYLGVAPAPHNRAAIAAHAWLRAGDKIVTGEQEAAQHQKIASFARLAD